MGDIDNSQTKSDTHANTPPQKLEGGVAFDTPKTAAEVEREDSTPVVSLEEVDRELEKAGVTPEDDAPSWLANKKAALIAQPAPPIPPKPQPKVATTTEGVASVAEIKKKNYSDILRPLRTYKDDIARAIAHNKVSRADMSVAEQERNLGKMEEERSQLALKEKIAQDRERLEQLKRPQRNQLIEDAPKTSAATERTDTEKSTPPVRPQKTETVTAEAPDTYAVGELAEQAAAARGIPLPTKKLELERESSPIQELDASLKAQETELERRTAYTREAQPVLITEQRPSSKVMKLVIVSFLLLILGAGALGGTLYMYRDKTSPLSPLEIKTLVFAEQTQEIPVNTVTGNTFVGLLSTRAEGVSAPLNGITHLKLTLSEPESSIRELSTQEFFEKAETKASSGLIRALHPKFMLGVHSFEGPEPFLVFKTSFYENSFAGMLEWETSMSRDLAPLFGSALLRESINATSTSAGGIFKDRLVNNIDTRILLDLNGETRLMYSFIDKQTLVITTNRDTFIEIVNRLNSTRVSR